MEDKLLIRTMQQELIEVEPSYDGYRRNKDDVIMITLTDCDDGVSAGMTVEQTKKLITYLTEVVAYIENTPKSGDYANILDGKFKGFTGKIYDIDKVASVREAMVEIETTLENESFYAFVSLCDLEVVRLPEVAE